MFAALGLFLLGFLYFGADYRAREQDYHFYQKYLGSAVSIYCTGSPDVRDYLISIKVVRERLDLAAVDCAALAASPRLAKSMFNGWHDSHVVFSTLTGHMWRWWGLSWQALWPMIGMVAGLTFLALYAAARSFGLPWYWAVAGIPILIPWSGIADSVPFFRDFSKVPFILAAFALCGVFFRAQNGLRARLAASAGIAVIVAIGVGFRQDVVVILPVALAAMALAEPPLASRAPRLTAAATMALTLGVYVAMTIAMAGLKTTEPLKYEGMPHFMVQGFADEFWEAAGLPLRGLSFVALYTDFLPWAFVDANDARVIDYVLSYDPAYRESAVALWFRWAALAPADMLVRILTALSAIAHMFWHVKWPVLWLALLLLLAAVGGWRRATFVGATMAILVAVGTLQFGARHVLHLIFLDRVLLAAIAVGLVPALLSLWRRRPAPDWKPPAIAVALLTVTIASTVAVATQLQSRGLADFSARLEALPWVPTEAEHRQRAPEAREAWLRLEVDPAMCPGGRFSIKADAEGLSRSYTADGAGGRRFVYLAVTDPAIVPVSFTVESESCVVARHWGPLGDGSLAPVQFFDPRAALAGNRLLDHLARAVGALF